MIRIKNILAAQDFSDCSRHALEAAIRMAAATGAKLHVVYVQLLHDEPFTPTLAKEHQDRIRDAVRSSVADRFKQVGDIDLEYDTLRDVSAAPALVRYAEANDIDLMVVGTHGRRGLRRLMLGSVAEEAVRTAPCPVLTVHQRDTVDVLTPGPNAEILLPLDFSSRSLEVIPTARQLAAATGARLRVMHVVEEVVHPAFYNAGAYSIYDLQPDVEERALEHLRKAYSKAHGPAVPVVFEVRVGHPAAEIVESAHENGDGMIVMATHGLTGLGHVLMGSEAERVVRTATCPVLTIRTMPLPEIASLTSHELAEV
ncbi:MAG: universal stress protein [Rhodothermales bacterium]|nr:universal stress protein [Rhodothermales bacterium]MBO6779741.1 universal stress protein [Rhodothermales bacterium]